MNEKADGAAQRDTLTPQEKTKLYEQVKHSFGSDLVSALGVVQGVALTELGVVIMSNFHSFTVANWLQAATTFLTLIAIWDTITKDGLIWRWVPRFEESLLPFFLGGVELFLSYSVGLGITAWLFAMALAAVFRGIGYRHVLRRATEEDETSILLERVQGRLWFALFYSLAGAVLFAGFAVVTMTGSLATLDQVPKGAITLIGLAVVFLWVVGSIAQVAAYWKRIIEEIDPREMHKTKNVAETVAPTARRS